jgi:outer membrane protein assembly factor BamD (BamD/ComL family)
MDVTTTLLLRRHLPRLSRGLLALAMTGLCSCAGIPDKLNVFKPAVPTESPSETLTLGKEGLEPAKVNTAAMPEDVAGTLGAAREEFRREQYDKAERLFSVIAAKEKNPPAAVQEAMYYEAECLRLTGHYPRAADLYSGLLGKFPNTPYREQCVQHMYDIANYWLDDTRKEMREEKEKAEGKRWFVWPHFVSFEKTKPLLDREGRAIEKLEQVRLHDINGPLADQALFMCGTVKMFNENYRDADHYFSQIHARHPESPLAPKAIELAIFCKHMSTGGSDYDGRKTAEARKLVQAAFRSYPQLANDPGKRKFLQEQLVGIDLQQAEKDYKMAEFYRGTGHPGSAYFYYELVQRRYPSTPYAEKARESWNKLRAKLEKDKPDVPPAEAVVKAPSKPVAAPAPERPQPVPTWQKPPAPAPSGWQPPPSPSGSWQPQPPAPAPQQTPPPTPTPNAPATPQDNQNYQQPPGKLPVPVPSVPQGRPTPIISDARQP